MNNSTADVAQAIDLVLEEVQREMNRILQDAGEEMKKGNREVARQALLFGDKLDEFTRKITELKNSWKALQLEIEESAPEVKKIVLPTKVIKKKTGYTRKVESVGPRTNFRVKFSDGTTIEERTAKHAFALSIEKIGADRIFRLGILLAGEPLLSKDKSIYKKEPRRVELISNGWYVKTHSSTGQKMGLLQKIASALGENIQFEILR